MMRARLHRRSSASTARAAVLLAALAGCADGTDEAGSESEAAQTPTVVSAERLKASWQVRMSVDANRAPFEAHPGWGAMFKRDLPGALAAFQADPGDGRGLARVHADLANVYRQAAWMGAQATRHIYGTDRQATDPAQAAYLLGVAHGLAGDCAASAKALGELSAPGKGLSAHHKYWSARAAAADCPAPPDAARLAALPGAPTAVSAGSDPGVAPLPHRTFQERSPEARDVHTGELTHLYTLALGHHQVALSTAPEAEQALLVARSTPWLLPVEAPQAAAPALESAHDEWLFLDFALVGADYGFVAAAHTDGLAAVEAWKDRSILAAVIAPAVTPEGLDVEVVIDRAAELRIQLRGAMEAASGSPMPFQPGFAQIGEVSVLRAGMILADANDQYRDAGILRINAFERSDGPGRDPVFLLSTAAWDAGNRSPLRAQEIIHGLVSRYPSIRTARYPLDALHIRLGRTAAPTTAVH